MIFLTSDLHFGHDKEFIYKKRGFESYKEMDKQLIKNWNDVVSKDDDVYMLGDFMLGNNKLHTMDCISKLNGKIHLCIGNHDTDSRLKEYQKLSNIVEVAYGYRLKYMNQSVYMSHYPTLTSNADEHKSVTFRVINFHGHTHQQTNFVGDNYLNYHVGVDSHKLKPISINEALKDVYRFEHKVEKKNRKWYNKILNRLWEKLKN